MIPIELFGKDHWSLFAYLETRCVDYSGEINIRHLRYKARGGWSPSYGTRLRGYFEDKENPSLLLQDHDDFDCIDDLEAAGLIENKGTGINPLINLTEKGRHIAGLLREHKTTGGMFANFCFKDKTHWANRKDRVIALSGARAAPFKRR